MNARLRLAVATIGIVGAFFGAMSQSSAASKAVMTCDSNVEPTLCLSEPQESPEKVILANQTTTAPTMAKADDLSGGALTFENEVALVFSIDPLEMGNLPGEEALASAMRAKEQIRSVEVFLRTASPEGDLTVISAGQR